ncbi:MAG: hypothetical protein ACRDO1_03460 [Nocardioidaceae bacterium]
MTMGVPANAAPMLDDGLPGIAKDNNASPPQACKNNVPGDALGGKASAEDVTGALGLDGAANDATKLKNCDQSSEQRKGGDFHILGDVVDRAGDAARTGGKAKGVGAPDLAPVDKAGDVAGTESKAPSTRTSRLAPANGDDDGDDGDDGGSLANLSDNNVGPFQACNNNVPVNVLGIQGSLNDVAAILGFDMDGNTASTDKNCDQDSYQANGDDGGDESSLVNVSDNNVGPFQACNNNVPVNVLGGQGAGSDAAGVGGFDNDGNTASTNKDCEQESYQDNGDDGDGSLVNVSDNNVGPFQACNNNVPVNVLGIQGAFGDVAAVLGFDNDGNSTSTDKNCEQESYQHNGGDDGDDDGSLVNVSENNAGPGQACNNNVPVNVLGGQGAGSDAAGVAGFDNDGNTASTDKDCEQESYQHNGGDNGDDGSLLNASNNNAGPGQACNNNVPVNVLGIQGALGDAAAVLGFDNDGNAASTDKSCEQESYQQNGGDNGDNGDGDDDSSLVNASGNNGGPGQACNNNVSPNVLGGQGTASDVTGVGGFDNDGNTTSGAASCEQVSDQYNGTADSDDGSLASVSDNYGGPGQVCANPVSPNVLGGEGAASAVAAVVGFDSDGNSTDSASDCIQTVYQGDDPNGDDPDGDDPDGDDPDGDDPDGDDGTGNDGIGGGDDAAASDPAGNSLLPNTGGPAAILLVLGLLGLAGGALVTAWSRLRRGAHS